MVNDDDIVEIVLSENNEQDANDCNDNRVCETQKKISFEAVLTALKTITEFIEQQPDDSLIAREDMINLQRLRRSIELSRVKSLRQESLDRFMTKLD